MIRLLIIRGIHWDDDLYVGLVNIFFINQILYFHPPLPLSSEEIPAREGGIQNEYDGNLILLGYLNVMVSVSPSVLVILAW